MKNGLICLLSTGLLLGSIGCASDDGGAPASQGFPAVGDPNPGQPGAPSTKPSTTPSTTTPSTSTRGTASATGPDVPLNTVLASLVLAADCTDLLTQIQDDAIAKLKMQVELYKKQPPPGSAGAVDAGVSLTGGGTTHSSATSASDTNAGAPGAVAPPASSPSTPTSKGESASAGNSASSGPASASETNKQVEAVDEADFVKVVENGKGIFLLHGNTLRKLKSWPAAETALVNQPLLLEGSPSEMFVTDQGKAVVFSSVYGYQSTGGKGPYPGGPAVDVACAPGYGGCGYYGNSLKITVADVTGDKPKVERELFYDGSYLSSRRYAAATGDIVRAVVQANSKFSGLFSADIEWYDAWGRPYDQTEIAAELDEWQTRTIHSIRKTKLEDWVPVAHEVKEGKLVDIQPACDSYYVPEPGLADYGLTHVLTLDVDRPNAPVGGVTIVGAASTVYSNSEKLVLAQPDYRWGMGRDFGIVNEQQTALHVFDLAGAQTKYVASGFVFGALPANNPQFGIDVAKDGTLRLATTGWVREQPQAKQDSPEFWRQRTDNRVLTARQNGAKIELVGKSPMLGHDGEQVQSARFVGDRGYVVTYRQKDPLIVVDVANASAPTVLGELEIPGFSQYVHPIDANHLVTVGQSATGGIRLQLFDVTNPMQLPPPRWIDFGSGSSTEVSYNHKALTAFEDKLALPMYSYGYLSNGRSSYLSTLEVVKVDVNSGFTSLASIDHARLYSDNGVGVQCGVCDAMGCYDYGCSYQPELRRGHFVKGDDGKTFVYSFSYAGVLVHDLGALGRPVAKVGLPAPTFNAATPWYGPTGMPVSTQTQDAGVAVTPPKPTTSAGTVMVP